MTTRDAYLAAGLEPRLYECWRSLDTNYLRACLAELEANGIDIPDEITRLRLEIAYRTDTAEFDQLVDNLNPGFDWWPR